MDERLYSLFFLIFNESLFAINQITTLMSSQLTMVSRDFRFLSAYKRLVSSAKRKKVSFSEAMQMSFA